jgi:Nuclease-related domain
MPATMSEQEQQSESGAAGRSAWREYERRRDRRRLETSARSRLLRALLGPSAKEGRRQAEDRHWAIGARGEELLAESLAKRCPKVFLLHDRCLPHGRSNIDHIAIAASGVYVIDSKRYRGKIEVVKPLFASPKLRIAGRDRTKLVDGLTRQVAVIEAALRDFAPDVAVHGCLCFVTPEGLLADVGLPLLRTLKINGCNLYYPRRLARRLNRSGPLTSERALAIRAELAKRLPAA